MLTIYSVTKNQNLTPDVTTVLFDLQVVILAGILYQWSTHTVMGTEIGVNPHGEFIPYLIVEEITN